MSNGASRSHKRGEMLYECYVMSHEATEYFIIFVNKSRNVISENKLFANGLAGSNNDRAKLFLVSAEWVVGLTKSIPSLP